MAEPFDETVDVKLRFYPNIGPQNAEDDGIRFNIDGTFLYQQLQFRLRESSWWLGGNFLYINAENSFDLGGDPGDGLPDPLDDFEQGGLGVFVEYDGRNTTFTPSNGLKGILEYRNYDRNWGSDFDYEHYMAGFYHYTPFGDWSSLGLRFEAETVGGLIMALLGQVPQPGDEVTQDQLHFVVETTEGMAVATALIFLPGAPLGNPSADMS